MKELKMAYSFIQGGIIEEIGKNIEIPLFYREWNCSGKTIYPGFIDPHLLSGSEDPSLLSLGYSKQFWHNPILHSLDFQKTLTTIMIQNLVFREFIRRKD